MSLNDPIILPGVTPVVSRENTPPEVTAAVIGWVTQSNGRAEGALFTLESPLAPDEVGIRTIEALDLSCLAGGGLLLWQAKLDEVVTALVDAAADTDAAWRSVTALAGGSPAGCSWWVFEAVNSWFHRSGRDVGVVCLRRGGHVMAVVAATDPD
jgi:hypothetical protein